LGISKTASYRDQGENSLNKNKLFSIGDIKSRSERGFPRIYTPYCIQIRIKNKCFIDTYKHYNFRNYPKLTECLQPNIEDTVHEEAVGNCKVIYLNMLKKMISDTTAGTRLSGGIFPPPHTHTHTQIHTHTHNKLIIIGYSSLTK